MKRKALLRSTIALAALLAACAPATRSIDAPGTGGGSPGVYAVEREAREGKVTLPGRGTTTLNKRVAVVIGNSAYANVSRLKNPRNDANAMAAVLRQNGFQVVQGTDIGKRSFERLLRNAVRAGGPGAEIVAFYAGHGFQVGSKNYLVPVDAKLATTNDLPFQTVRLNTILRILGDRSDRHISFLDSCRNNPFPDQDVKTGASRGTSTPSLGFSEPAVPRGGFVAYSTKPGAVAYDGEGTANSPFTGALLSNIRSSPGASLLTTLQRVRSSVRSATSGRQTPTWTSRISGNFAFSADTRPAEISPKVAEVGATTAAAAPTRPSSAPGKAPVPGSRPSVTVDAPMEKVVAAGGRIAEKLNLPPEAKVSVVRPPEKGNVATITNKASLADSAPKDVPVADAGAIVYVAPPDQKASSGSAAGDAVTDKIVVEVKMPDAPPERIDVTLRLTPDTCDVEAGDFLDLQGVNVYRPERSISPNRAIRACAGRGQAGPGERPVPVPVGQGAAGGRAVAGGGQCPREGRRSGPHPRRECAGQDRGRAGTGPHRNDLLPPLRRQG